jgi:hypothetical protein
MSKRAKGPPVKHDEFVFWVRRPSLDYGFRLQHDRYSDDPYYEDHSLSFVAECLYPDRFKGREAQARFFADHKLTAGSEHRSRRPEDPPKAVGSILVGKARFEMSGFLPTEACWRLGGAMAAGTITAMTAGAAWIKRGHAHLGSMMWHGPEFDPVSYIG